MKTKERPHLLENNPSVTSTVDFQVAELEGYRLLLFEGVNQSVTFHPECSSSQAQTSPANSSLGPPDAGVETTVIHAEESDRSRPCPHLTDGVLKLE